MNTNKRASYHEIKENLDLKRILKVDYYKIGIILDLDCPNGDKIYDQVIIFIKITN